MMGVGGRAVGGGSEMIWWCNKGGWCQGGVGVEGYTMLPTCRLTALYLGNAIV